AAARLARPALERRGALRDVRLVPGPSRHARPGGHDPPRAVEPAGARAAEAPELEALRGDPQPAARPLRLVHRLVGAPEKLLHVRLGVPAADGDAKAGSEVRLRLVTRPRRGPAIERPLDDSLCLSLVAARQKQRKLVASDPESGVVAPDAVREDPGKVRQRLV